MSYLLQSGRLPGSGGEERTIRRTAVIGVGLAIAALFSASCVGHGFTGKSVGTVPPPATESGQTGVGVAGDVLAPGPPVPVFLFERATPPADIQPGSVELATLIDRQKDLHVVALKSTRETAAVILVEVSTHQKWGRLMIPAERQIIRAFAEDPKLGKWLILLTDVDVRGEPDPIPLTAYRWTRDDVEQYDQCGIPSAAIDDCTQAFYEVARTVLVAAGAQAAQR
jgi:hypothetical protein